MLKRLGFEMAVQQASSIEELRTITLDFDGAEITLAIRDVLHPAGGEREEQFRGLRERGLKHILRNRLADLKKDREKVLCRRTNRKDADWTDRLILGKDGGIKPNLANLILILRDAEMERRARL